MQRVIKVFKWVVSIVVILVLLTGSGGYLYLRNSLPQLDGTLKVAGLSAPVEIIRDTDAVPHIYAENKLDAYFGLGYVHAQDRLWEMEIWRRITQGRFAEVFGENALGSDRYLRTLGLQRAGESAWQNLAPETKDIVNAYSAGVNAFLSAHHGSQLPLEFTVFGIVPEPWTSVDSVSWAKIFALDLASNMGTEIFHDDLSQTLGAERAQQLFPSYPASGPVIIPGTAQGSGQRSRYEQFVEMQSNLQSISGIGGPQTGAKGSNSWVVDASKSASGKPIMANDPHLTMTIPGWYVAHLSAGDFDVIGATIPGLPAVVLGRNRHIAWGFTGLNPDVQDVYRERLDDTGTMAEFQGKMEPMQIINESIKVLGGPPVTYQVRITRHGPLISDAINAGDQDSIIPPYLRRPAPFEPMALRWTALDPADTTAEAFLGLAEAHNWDEVVGSLSHLVAPGLNFVYADVDGNIGYYSAAGRIPIRSVGDGSVPLDGWTGTNEWKGWVPFEEMPYSYNPPEHFIATANNKPISDDYPHFLGNEWTPPYRAQRIVDLLNKKEKFSLGELADMQGDTVSLQSRELLPVLLKLVTAKDDNQQRALQLLQDWDGDTNTESIATTIYEVWWSHLPRAVVQDELGRRLSAVYQGNFTFTSSFILSTLEDRTNIWCDNVTTAERTEDCAEVAQQTFEATLADLKTKLGDDMNAWQWKRLHTSLVFHVPFFSIPPLRPIFSRSAPNGGDSSTINMGAFFGEPYSPASDDLYYVNSFGPSYRQVIDLADPDGGGFIETVGQSGHILSPHYGDFFDDWLAVRLRKLRFTRASVDAAHEATLYLEPQQP